MLDTESLLQPISDAAPTGVNLRDDPSPSSPYYQIKDARNAARAVERAAQASDDPSSAPQPDWSAILDGAPHILSGLSKDLEVAAWYLEALVREEGYGGLADGFDLVRGLIKKFWNDIYPKPDEDGVSTRIAPLTGLNGDESDGTLIVPIGMVALLEDDQGDLGPWHFRSARDLQVVTDPEVRQRRIESGAVSMERFDAALLSADPGALFAHMDEIERAIAAFSALCDALDERCGRDGPPVSNIRNAMQESLDCVRFLTRNMTRPVGGGAAVAAAPSAGGMVQAAPPGVIASRSDALESLTKIRDYYRKAEPHSPLPYLFDQALRWAQMPLHQLVAELIPDQDALSNFKLRVGMPAHSNTDGSTDA